MSAIRNTQAFVIRVSPKGESSLLVRLFSESEGKLILIAKGAKQSKSRFRGLLEPFSLLNIHYNEVKERPWQFLSHAEYADPYITLKHNGDALLYGAVLLEIIDKTQENHPDPAVFNLLKTALHAMDQNIPADHVHWAFILHYLQLQGAPLNLNRCYSCGSKPEKAFFFPYEGMIYCENCVDGSGLSWELPENIILSLRALAEQDYDHAAVTSENKELMNRILWNTLATRFDGCRRLRSVETLRKVL